jgi:hypothetical protein
VIAGAPVERRPRKRVRTAGLDRFELACLGAFTALAFAVLAGLLARVWVRGGLVTGSDGYLVADQLQYLTWLRQMGEHLAAANLYDLAAGPRTFVHPALMISGLVHQLGLGLVAAYVIWKPVAVAALFAGTLLSVRRYLGRAGDRHLALVLALFTASPISALVGWAGIGGFDAKFDFDFLGGELWPGTYLWGYFLTGVAVGVMPLGLLAYERARVAGARQGRMLAAAAGAGLICSWFQPWQGATLALILVGSELLAARRGDGRLVDGARRLILPLAGTAAPLVYYFVLSKTDEAWALADKANAFPRWPWWVTVIGLAPLALPAILGYLERPRDFGETALRLWPLAGLAVFYLPFGTFPFHAFQGLTLPLVLLAVVGVRARLGDRPVPLLPAVVVAALMIIPGTAYRVDAVRDAVAKGRQPHFLTADEHDALRYLDSLPERGGVLTPVYSGLLVPAYTGRETWVGAGSWSPDFDRRSVLAERLFDGELGPGKAERVVRRSGARFLYSDCHGRADIARLVAAFTDPPRHFGCATVYTVRSTGEEQALPVD